MTRITITFDERRAFWFCADEEVEIYVVETHPIRENVYRWSSTKVGREHVDKQLGDWPVYDKITFPPQE